MFYPQNGDRIVTMDYVTSLHPVYKLGCSHGCVECVDGHALQCARTLRRSLRYLVGDGLCDGVPVGRRLVPVGLADEQDHAGRDADEEAEGCAEAERRHLEHRLVLRRQDHVPAARSVIPARTRAPA